MPLLSMHIKVPNTVLLFSRKRKFSTERPHRRSGTTIHTSLEHDAMNLTTAKHPKMTSFFLYKKDKPSKRRSNDILFNAPLHNIVPEPPLKIRTLAGTWMDVHEDYRKNAIPRNRKGEVKRRRIRGKSKRHKRGSPPLSSFKATLLPIPEAHMDEAEDHNCHPRKKRRHDRNDSCHLSVDTSISPLNTSIGMDAKNKNDDTSKVVHAISPTCQSPVPKTCQQSRSHCKTKQLVSNDIPVDGDGEFNANVETTTASIIHDGRDTKDDALDYVSSLVDDFTSQFANAVLTRDLRVLKRALQVVEESATPRWMHTLACGKDGNTLLMLAIMTQWREGIEFFCSKGWNIHQKNKEGKTALGIAMTLRDPGIALLLLRIH